MSKQILEMRQQRAKCVHDAQEILKKFSADPKSYSAEENQRAVSFLDEADKLKERIDLEERALDAAADVEKVLKRASGNEDTKGKKHEDRSKDDEEKQYAEAFGQWARYGLEGVEAEKKTILRNRFSMDTEERAAQTVTTTGGGYLVPQGLQNEIEKAMLPFSGMMESGAQIWRTNAGNPITWPTMDDTSNKGALLAINTQESNQAVVFGQVVFNAFKFTSKNILVPIELMQDSAFNFDTFINPVLAERLGRVFNQYLTTGAGTTEPKGVVTAATAGITATLSTSVSYNDLLDLIHSVNRSYRVNGKFMFADSTLKVLKKLVDTQNRPLFLPGLALREPDTINGYPFIVNDDMAAIEASAKSVLFGDFSKYKIRMVNGIIVMRLVERYADYYQIGFQAFARMDGNLMDAGTHPIKYITHPSP
jgi:HK97 family phage major capsid protein